MKVQFDVKLNSSHEKFQSVFKNEIEEANVLVLSNSEANHHCWENGFKNQQQKDFLLFFKLYGDLEYLIIAIVLRKTLEKKFFFFTKTAKNRFLIF